MNGKIKVTACFSLMIMFLVMGTVVFHFLEHWNYVDSLYYSTVTLLTINYGDIAPATEGARLFTIFYVIIGASLILASITTMADYFYNEAFASAGSNLDNINLNMKRKRQRI